MPNANARVAAIQMASGPNMDANLLEADRLIQEAATDGAQLVVLPENFGYIGVHEADILTVREHEGTGTLQSFLSEAAAKYHIWIVGGTVPLRDAGSQRVRASCLVYDDRGRRVARYDKIHMFDVVLPGANERYEESATIVPGEEVVVIETPVGRMGLAVCYDLRFPELFRHMAAQGAQIFALPSAFTALTGKAHWETLVRARAIENLSYVIAAAQGGYHVNGRETYGNTMIVDHWGVVLAHLARGNGYVCHSLDLEYQASVRSNFPVLEHMRLLG